MRLQVLGCSGGIGDGLHTSAYLVDNDVLIDAGTGLCRVSPQVLQGIDHVLLTHAHLDHIASLPMLIEARRSVKATPLTVHALDATIDALRTHVFNWSIWPDVTKLPSADAPSLAYAPLRTGEPIELAGRRFTALPADHPVPTAGFLLEGSAGAVLFSGDTTVCAPFWQRAAETENLLALIVEVSYHDGNRERARAAGHLCPSMLAAQLPRIPRPTDVWVVHLKPFEAERIERELASITGIHSLRVLRQGDTLSWSS